MKWFYNQKISVKLISSFMLIAIIMTYVGFYGMTNMGKIKGSLDDMYHNQLIAVQALTQAQVDYNDMRSNVRKLFMSDDSKVLKETLETNKNNMRSIEESMDLFKQTDLSPASKEGLAPFDERWNAVKKVFDEAANLSTAGRKAELEQLIDGELTEKSLLFRETLNKLVDTNVNEAEQAMKQGEKVYRESRNVTIAIIISAVLLSILLGYIISRVISRPLQRVVNLVAKVAKGDLRETSGMDTKDEVGALSKSIDEMILNLRQIVGGILTNSDSVSAAAQQISSTTQEIASGNTEQAVAAQTITELFKELSMAIHSVAQNTEQASELSNETVSIAKDGDEIIRLSMNSMKQVSGTMSRLEEDSHKIGNIIEVIEDIADQTNLLALNAAIEAARAGDQGRGFAVVADEVRRLAERSGDATKQITAIIKGMQENTRQSVAAVKESDDLSQRTGESFRSIAMKVNEAGEKVSEIAAASEEQAAQATTVLHSVENISAATEEAAAASQETASTAQMLAQIAEDLEQSVSVFKV